MKTATMHATGKVIEISGSTVKIERTVKGEAEAMTFALEKPFGDVAVNDFVKIDYVEKEGVLTALKMNKIRLKERSVHADSVQSAPVKK
ncbi:MAG TPA: hypothetical protein PLT45_01880 [Smithella sp.]|nr:hypothetical protein [Smithella sp.]